MSKLKIKDGDQWTEIPAGGVGVPSGGSQGDILVKSSSTDYSTEWNGWDIKIATLNTELFEDISGNTDYRIKTYRLGNIVYISGAVKTTSSLAASGRYTIGTIDSTACPATNPAIVAKIKGLGTTVFDCGITHQGLIRIDTTQPTSVTVASGTTVSIFGSYLTIM